LGFVGIVEEEGEDEEEEEEREQMPFLYC